MERIRAVICGMLVIALGGAAQGARPAAIPQASNSQHSAWPAAQRVNINQASLEDLLTIPGMTQSWAGRIVRFRPYRSKQDLLDRGIVSGEVYNRIKDFIIAHRERQ